jgi:hypothetical protein
VVNFAASAGGKGPEAASLRLRSIDVCLSGERCIGALGMMGEPLGRPLVRYFELPLAADTPRKRPKGGQRSLRDISAELAQQGIFNERGLPFSAASINSMLRSR